MKASVEKNDKNQVKITIEVEAERFEKAIQRAYLKNRKSIAIPGFRKGKAPRIIIERHYGEAIFYDDAINEVCPEAYAQAVEENKIEPVDSPEIDIIQIGEGQNLIFTATVTVKPEVELGQYKGIEVEKVEYNVTDQEVDEHISQIRESNARWIEVKDRAVKNGDRVTLDYSGFMDGEQFEGGTAKNQSLEIGSGRFIPGFEEQLLGMMPGEEKEIKVVFPDNYTEELRGKEALFVVTVHEIKEKELPELDDEFAKDVSEFDSLEDFRAHIKKSMEDEMAARAKAEMEDRLIAKVTENAQVDIPEVMVQSQLDSIMRDIDLRMRYRGMDLDSYLKMADESLDNLRAQYRDKAYNRVKTQLVLEKIIQVEKIEVNDEDIEKEYIQLAEQFKKDVEEIKKDYSDHLEHIKEGITVKKAIDLLMKNAVLVEKAEEKSDNQNKTEK